MIIAGELSVPTARAASDFCSGALGAGLLAGALTATPASAGAASEVATRSTPTAFSGFLERSSEERTVSQPTSVTSIRQSTSERNRMVPPRGAGEMPSPLSVAHLFVSEGFYRIHASRPVGGVKTE